MKYIELRPIKTTEEEFSKVEALIKEVFRKKIFSPIIKILTLSERVLNAEENALFKALRDGKISYRDGRFSGKFTAQISKILQAYGATWDRSSQSFKLGVLPSELRQQIEKGRISYETKMERISRLLSKINPETIAKNIRVTRFFEEALFKVDKDFRKSLTDVGVKETKADLKEKADSITIGPNLTEDQAAKIAVEWQNNLDLYIKRFTEEQIVSLRKTVQQSIFEGNRFESLISGIKKSYAVTEKKARFLARQETKLLMAKFKQAKYTAAGINEYRWYCVKRPHDTSPHQHTLGNVRYYHAILENQVFRWDNPPLSNKNPDRRNNPGEDYNCRCFARPLLRR